MGRFALGNWPGITNKIIGFLALLVILIGARMTVWTETKQQEYSKNLRSAVLLLLVGKLAIGYILLHLKQRILVVLKHFYLKL